jgi:hypothetical protein
VAVFGRRTARQRLQKATRDALSVPTFRTPDDCTPWVLGGLWPAELHQVTAETATIAEYLEKDLHRIADSANHKLRAIGEASMPEPVRRAEQNRVIELARAFAVQRVESTVRQLRQQRLGFTRSLEVPAPAEQPIVVESVREVVIPAPPTESAEQRLRRLIDGVARQEPGLRWAAGLRADGSTVLVTDLAYGWIPPGITLPPGVDVLPPGRRSGSARALLGATESSASYAPGDPFSNRDKVSGGGRSLPTAADVDDLGWQLTEATRWRDGLPRMTHTLAKAAASGTGVVDGELDVLRVHLDTARYQLVARYPTIESGLLLNCLLLAATDALAAGERNVANYHFGWFQTLSAPPTSNSDPRP